MKVQIFANHIDLSKHHRDYITELVSSLENLCSKVTDESVSCKINVSNSNLKNHFEVRALLLLPGIDMRAESKKAKLEASIKDIVSKLSRQIKRYKTKHAGRKRILLDSDIKKSELKSPMLSEILDVSESNDKSLLKKITKRKVFSNLIPMTAVDALKSMLDLDHEFFVFVNIDTDRYNLLYTRKGNKGYGLVELESKSGVLNYKLTDLL